jgi:hypothetical protein
MVLKPASVPVNCQAPAVVATAAMPLESAAVAAVLRAAAREAVDR